MCFKKRNFEKPLLLVFLASFVISSLLEARVNYFSFKIDSGDFAIFEQMFHNSLQGRLLWNSFEGGSHLGVHFSPIFLLFLPLMWLFESTLSLMAVAAIGLAAAAWMLYRYLEHEDAAPIGVLMALMLCHYFHLETYRYFGRVFPSELLQWVLADYLTLTYDSIRDFHALALLPLPFFGAFIAHRRQRYVAFMVWCLVILAIRENLVLIPISWAVIGLIQSRTKRWIIGPVALAAFYLLLYLAASTIWQPVIQPSLLDYYQGYGRSASEIWRSVVADPGLPLRYLFQESKLEYLLVVLKPFLFVLPFFRWWWLPALPPLCLILFASNGRLFLPHLHYSVEIVALLVCGFFHVGPGRRLCYCCAIPTYSEPSEVFSQREQNAVGPGRRAVALATGALGWVAENPDHCQSHPHLFRRRTVSTPAGR